MITGVVTPDREAVIRLTVVGTHGRQRQIEAVIDTGFDGWLSLPSSLIVALRLGWSRRGRAILADGGECIFDIYGGSVLWDRRRRIIPIHEADTTPLVGMALLEQSELSMRVRSGGRVIIRRLRA